MSAKCRVQGAGRSAQSAASLRKPEVSGKQLDKSAISFDEIMAKDDAIALVEQTHQWALSDSAGRA